MFTRLLQNVPCTVYNICVSGFEKAMQISTHPILTIPYIARLKFSWQVNLATDLWIKFCGLQKYCTIL